MLDRLIREIAPLTVQGNLAIDVNGITFDSRQVAAGNVFIACPGQKVDGRSFIATAVAAGAAAVVCEPPAPRDIPVPLIVVADARAALADLAAAWYGHPSRSLALVGVTGTDGKTTTTHLIAAILNAAGRPTGLISTVAIENGRGSERNRTSQTTPEAPVIQQRLAEMRAAGVEIGVVEVSSHALVTARVRSCEFDCAVFTNLDPEHLDFHKTVESYRDAKAMLFAQLDCRTSKPWGTLAVINRDDPTGSIMRGASHAPSIDYTLSDVGDVRGEVITSSLRGQMLRVTTPDEVGLIRTRLAGRHNAYNWLAAIAAARHFGASLRDAQAAAEVFGGVPGRLEAIHAGQRFHLFVDFAHTPQALAATLSLLRQHTKRRLIVVFGQAGRRDHANRRRMAEAAAMYADVAVLTSDDPYDEDPRSIVDELAEGLAQAGWQEGRNYWRIVDRVEAIEWALQLAEVGDCVLLAGRGPEEVTIVGDQKIPLLDAAVARAALRRTSAA